jgi:hypothetical protein
LRPKLVPQRSQVYIGGTSLNDLVATQK